MTNHANPNNERGAPWEFWGDQIDSESKNQLHAACQLPIAVKGALMPDAHVGYGLPIGGVLATDNAVIPYGVGVDIACRMKLTITDIPVKSLSQRREKLIRAIEKETRFGIGAHFKEKRTHDIMDKDWSISPITQNGKDKAWAQLGTSGSGNHFVEFGLFNLAEPLEGLETGTYVALLSHSGSRGLGARVCDHYSAIAKQQVDNLPKTMSMLAWLDLDTEAGQEYWKAMELMGDYAAANHELIHRHVLERYGANPLLQIENHHNYAWKETHLIDGEKRLLVVHRKGATPAGPNVLGIIPGSMATTGFLVRGKGSDDSLNSAAHGAGRVMSRKRALSKFQWQHVNQKLKEAGVTLISAGLDEVPMVYKDIESVMTAQADLVDKVGRFDPKIVKMAPPGEKPED